MQKIAIGASILKMKDNQLPLFFLSLIVYPLLIFISGLIAFFLIQNDINIYIFAPILIGTFAGFIAVFEQIIPYKHEWNLARNDILVDTVHTFVNLTLGQLILVLYDLLSNMHILTIYLWSSSTPLILQLAFTALLIEFGLYWVHRLSHKVNWLWRLHAIHHSPERLYWLNVERSHPLNNLLELIVAFLPPLLLGVNSGIIVIYGILINIHLMLQHSNINYRCGFLKYIFAVAELHRWHHLKDYKKSQVNFGGFLIIWDIIFGTYWDKNKEIGATEIGIDSISSNFPETYFKQVVWPFQNRQ